MSGKAPDLKTACAYLVTNIRTQLDEGKSPTSVLVAVVAELSGWFALEDAKPVAEPAKPSEPPVGIA